MHTRKITFKNASGHKLAALLDLPVDDEPVAYALFAHCFTCSKDYKGVARVSRALAAEGVAVLHLDHPPHVRRPQGVAARSRGGATHAPEGSL